MDSNQEEGQGSGKGKGKGRSTRSKGTDQNDHSLSVDSGSALDQHHASSTTDRNPLLTRLSQNSAERAHIAAFGTQLGPEGMQAPQVIGDFVGISSSSSSSSINISSSTGRNGGAAAAVAISTSSSTIGVAGHSNVDLHEVLESIRIEGEDEEFNELDAEDDGEDEDMTGWSTQTGPEGMSAAMRAEALSAISAVDPQQLIGAAGEGSPWGALEGFEQGMVDDDDELDENDPALEELGLSLAPRTQKEKRRMKRKGEVIYPPEIQKLLGMANHAYVSKDYKLAVDLFQQVIVTHPSVFQAWNIMGVIQEELGNTEKALQLYLVAAHLTPKDGALWKKLAVISKADKHDMDALWDRSVMYQILDQPNKAIQGFQKLLKVKPHYMPALEELVKIYSSLEQDNKRYRENMHQAMVDYEAAYLHYSSLPDRFSNPNGDPFDITDEDDQAEQQNEPFGYSALNMLSELYIMFEEYEKPITMIKTWSRRLQRRSHQTWWDDYKDDREFDTDPDDEDLQASLGENRTRGLPVDLRVKLGICRLMMEEVKEAKAQFRYLWKCSVEDFPDLYEEIAELYVSKQMWKEGYNVIRAMLQFDEMDILKNWVMAGECLRHMDQLKDAKDYLEQAHRADPSSVDVSMILAEVYEEMGNLPQALTLVNYVRQANAEKQALAERRRREFRLAKGKEGFKGIQPVQPYLDTEYALDPRYRSIIPHAWLNRPGGRWKPGSEAARALERIQEASRSRAAAERYSSADRERDIQLLKSMRELERAERLAAKENEAQELRDVIEKFNQLEIIFQRIDQKEKSRVWDNRREAVKMTREDRTQYIQVARDLINVFRSNRGFFPKQRTKPYLGVESRSWRFRKHASDIDAVLSEQVSEMSERLGRAMGVTPPKSSAEEAIENSGIVPPTTYKDVSFDAWYMLVIRQAVYLTYEDRYAEAAELLMVMFSANVFYINPRRRSGIMLVLLACAMWAGDAAAVLNAGRYLANFGGSRPFPIKIYQAVFTTGPRNHQKYGAWVQNVTYKYLKRQIGRMRTAIGKASQRMMRKVRKPVRKPRVGGKKRSYRKVFQLMPASQGSPNKKRKSDVLPSRSSALATLPWKTFSSFPQLNTPGESENTDIRIEQGVDDQPETSTALSEQRMMFDFTISLPENSSRRLRAKDLFAEKELQSQVVSEQADGIAVEESASTTPRKKRLLEDDAAGGSGQVEAVGGQDDQDEAGQDEEFDDDDDYDVGDEAYKTEEEEEESDADDFGDGEWDQDGSGFPKSRAKIFGKVSRRNISNADDDEDDGDDDDGGEVGGSVVRRALAGRRRSAGQKGTESALSRTDEDMDAIGSKRQGRAHFTREMYKKFNIGMVMFFGHVLAQSRSHVGSAAQFAECMDYAPYNPMIHLYLGIQFLNLAMQRTTPNRQMTLAQGLLFLQNYYRLRKEGYGTLMFSEREKENKAKGIPSPPPPIKPVRSIIGVQDEEPDWTAQATKASMEAISSDTSPTTSAQSIAAQKTAAPSKVPPTLGAPTTTTSSSSSSESNSAPPENPPLRQCQQEAEFNFARAFHQMGQNQLAMIHYRRVLELPSWRVVEREQQVLRKKQQDEEKEMRRKARAEGRAHALERKMRRAQESRDRKEARRIQMEVAKALGTTDVSEVVGGEDGEDDEEDEEDMDGEEEEEEEKEKGGEDGVGEEEEGEKKNASENKVPSRIQLRDSEEDDPTDLKREAAFNLAKIYLQSGAVGEAQLLMRKYCTI
ncbi:transcription factor TFIIIC subunit tfc4 [Gamsiella multidivaricata]|nr:transcription factor TFIIIC subunit tfc4 [Gamsiella multidivaricata]